MHPEYRSQAQLPPLPESMIDSETNERRPSGKAQSKKMSSKEQDITVIASTGRKSGLKEFFTSLLPGALKPSNSTAKQCDEPTKTTKTTSSNPLLPEPDQPILCQWRKQARRHDRAGDDDNHSIITKKLKSILHNSASEDKHSVSQQAEKSNCEKSHKVSNTEGPYPSGHPAKHDVLSFSQIGPDMWLYRHAYLDSIWHSSNPPTEQQIASAKYWEMACCLQPALRSSVSCRAGNAAGASCSGTDNSNSTRRASGTETEAIGYGHGCEEMSEKT